MVNEKMCQVFFDLRNWSDMEPIGECELGLLFKGKDKNGMMIVACNDEKHCPSDEYCLSIFEKIATNCVVDTGSTKVKTVEFKVVSFLKMDNNDSQYLVRVKHLGI